LNEKSRELNLEVEECSEDVEVPAMGGSGFWFVVNLQDDLLLQEMAGFWDTLKACINIRHIAY